MANYQKSISYLDYLENGMKIGNAGFVRTEENNGQLRLEVRIRNLPDHFSGQYDLHADCGGIIGQISLNRGSGSCCIVWKKEVSEVREEVEAGGIYLRLPGRRLVQTVWPLPIRLVVEHSEKPPASEQSVESEQTAQLELVQRETAQPKEPVQSKTAQPKEPALQEVSRPQIREIKQESLSEPPTRPGITMEPDMTAQIKTAPQPEQSPEPAENNYYSDKWEQLTHLYPLIHPFGDERAYLSIAPKDFVVLCREYQKLVHNSFLLHGFYNYHHLLLGKMQEKDEWHYYLGVPGNFYTREKMVAEMFGFEAFEGEKDPASPGDFGYYMKRVDI